MNRILAVLSLIVLASPSYATVVILEPDAFASGTDISNAWIDDGISLSSISRVFAVNAGAVEIGSVYSLTTPNAVTGSQGFSRVPTGNYANWYYLEESRNCLSALGDCNPRYPSDFAVMRMDFSRPIDHIEVYGGFTVDPIGLYALGSSGEILDSCFGHYAGDCFTSLWSGQNWQYGESSIHRSSRDIYSVIVGGYFGSSGIDMIRVTVPEPSSLALFATAGLMLLVMVRRRALHFRRNYGGKGNRSILESALIPHPKK